MFYLQNVEVVPNCLDFLLPVLVHENIVDFAFNEKKCYHCNVYKNWFLKYFLGAFHFR